MRRDPHTGAPDFFGFARDYLHAYMPKTRGLSPKTIQAYRISLECFLDYLAEAEHIERQRVSFDHFGRQHLKGWLTYLTPAVCLLIAASVIGLVASSTGIAFGDVLAQAAVTIPAVWTLIAVGAAAVGARPAIRLAGWGAIIAAFGLTILGPTFKLPEWALSISPLHHVPNITASPHWTGLAIVAVVFCLLTVVAFAGFRRRDIA